MNCSTYHTSNTGPLRIDYQYTYECELSNNPVGKGFFLMLLFIWVIYLMNLLAKTSSDYFSPTLSNICDRLHIPYDIAGVTFLAFGNGAPDFFSIIASVVGGIDVLVGLGGLLGAGTFVVTVVVGAVSVACPCEVSRQVFIRDVSFHILSVAMVAIVAILQTVTIFFAVTFIGLYFIYTGYVAYTALAGKVVEKAVFLAIEEMKSSSLDPQDAGWLYNSDDPKPSFSGSQMVEMVKFRSTEFLKNNNMKKDIELKINNRLSTAVWEDYYGTPSIVHENTMNTLSKGLLPSDNQVEESGTAQPNRELKYEEIAHALYWKSWMLQHHFKKHLDLSEWSNLSLMDKILFIVECPIVLACDLTVPTLDLNNWSKTNAVLHPFLSPLFLMCIFGYENTYVGEIPTAVFLIILAIFPSVLIYFMTHISKPPTGQIFTICWALTAFIMCISWIYLIAGELVFVLANIGGFLHLPPSLLGLTVLAWGNSIGDFFNNTSLARQGMGKMAIAGCYGAPVFNILLGLGIALSYGALTSYPTPYKVTLDTSSIVSLAFTFLALGSTLIVVSCKNFHIDKYFGMYLLSVYILFLIVQLVLLIMSLSNN
eukprot:gene11646-15598_t